MYKNKMMDEKTIDRLQSQRHRADAIKIYEDRQTVKFFDEQIRQEKIKQNKLIRTIKILVIGIISLITILTVNLLLK
jgi:hypothetical protein